MMNCPRCQGLMVHETYWDFYAKCTAWHCVICGFILDRTILKHRHYRHSTTCVRSQHIKFPVPVSYRRTA